MRIQPFLISLTEKGDSRSVCNRPVAIVDKSINRTIKKTTSIIFPAAIISFAYLFVIRD